MTLRQEARILAVQTLYSLDLSQSEYHGSPSDLGDLLDKDFSNELIFFAETLVAGVSDNLDDIDDLIESHLHNWTIDRLSRVDLAILRISVYSLIYQKDIPPKVVIDEAIKVAKKLSTEKSYSFINGILHNIVKDLQAE